MSDEEEPINTGNMLTDIRLIVARIDERQKADRQAAERHRHSLNNTLQTLATKDDLKAVDERVESLENDRTWLVRGVVGAWIAGSGVVATLLTKKYGG